MVDDSFAPRRPAVPPCHGRFGVTLVEEDEPVRIDVTHPFAPLLPLDDDFRIELLLRMYRLFFA